MTIRSVFDHEQPRVFDGMVLRRAARGTEPVYIELNNKNNKTMNAKEILEITQSTRPSRIAAQYDMISALILDSARMGLDFIYYGSNIYSENTARLEEEGFKLIVGGYSSSGGLEITWRA